MILAPNEVAWLATITAGFGATPHNAGPGAGIPQHVLAVAIAYDESRFNTEAVNDRFPPNWDLGVWQVSTRWGWQLHTKYHWRDPYDNARMLRAVFDGQARQFGDGFHGWTTYNNGLSAVALDVARLAVQHPWAPVAPGVTWRV
jgi:hypothetical protein